LNAIALHTTREAIKNVFSCIETRTCVGVVMERTLDVDLPSRAVKVSAIVSQYRYDIW